MEDVEHDIQGEMLREYICIGVQSKCLQRDCFNNQKESKANKSKQEWKSKSVNNNKKKIIKKIQGKGTPLGECNLHQ